MGTRAPPYNATLFALPLWGAAHCRRFLDVALPSWLAPGNLPDLARTTHIEFYIHTTEESAPRFCHRLLNCAERVRVRYIASADSDVNTDSGTVMRVTHAAALRLAWSEGMALSGVVGDEIWSPGLELRVVAARQRGALGLWVPSLPAPEALLRHTNLAAGPPLTPRALASALLEVSKWGYGGPGHSVMPFTRHPAKFFWPTGDGRGVLMRHFHTNLHWVMPEFLDKDLKHSIDNDLARSTLSDPSAAKVVTDSDEGLMLGVDLGGRSSDSGHEAQSLEPAPGSVDVANWMRRWTDAHTRYLFRHELWLHDGTVSARDRSRLSNASQAVAAEIFGAFSVA